MPIDRDYYIIPGLNEFVDVNRDFNENTRRTQDNLVALEADINTRAPKATTLAGYGIVDAYTKVEVDGTTYLLRVDVDALGDSLTALGIRADDIEAIAKGASRALVFDTEAAMQTWLSDPANVATLRVGDNLLIRALGVPDYWWDGTQPQILETAKVDLTNYYTIDQITALLAGKANASHTHDASNINSGIFAAARIPNLDASKITSGTMAPARIAQNSTNRFVTDAQIAAWNAGGGGGTPTFVYECTGENDNLEIENIVNGFFNGAGTISGFSMKLIVTGTMGISVAPGGYAMTLTTGLYPEGKACHIDFSDCDVIYPPNVFLRVVDAASAYDYVMSDKLFVQGLNVAAHEGVSLNCDGTATFQDCTFSTQGYSAPAIISGKRCLFSNCTFKSLQYGNPVWIAGEFHTFRDCTFPNSTILVEGMGHSFDGCSVEGGMPGSSTDPIIAISANQVRFSGCLLRSTDYVDCVGIYGCTGVSFDQCTIVGGMQSGTALTFRGESYVSIADCELYGAYREGGSILVYTGAAGMLTVCDSILIAPSNTIYAATGHYQMRIVLRGNLIDTAHGSEAIGIYQASAKNTIQWNVTGNSIYNTYINGFMSASDESWYKYMPAYSNSTLYDPGYGSHMKNYNYWASMP